MTITHIQARAARHLLGVDHKEVIEKCSISQSPFYAFEKNGSGISDEKKKALEEFYINRGVEFIDDRGVALRKCEDVVYRGQEGFRLLMEDVYETAKRDGGNISILNGSPDLFVKHLGADWYKSHADRMLPLKGNINFRIVAEQGGKTIAGGFAQYEWIARRDFHNQSIYIYGGKVAFINFIDDGVMIEVIDRKNMATTFNVVFDLVWDSLQGGDYAV